MAITTATDRADCPRAASWAVVSAEGMPHHRLDDADWKWPLPGSDSDGGQGAASGVALVAGLLARSPRTSVVPTLPGTTGPSTPPHSPRVVCVGTDHSHRRRLHLFLTRD